MNHSNASALNIAPFHFEGASIRVVYDDSGDPWFVAKDIAQALGYSWSGIRTIEHVPTKWRGVEPVSTISATQEMHTLSEQGVYFFLARSDKPKARLFQEWLAGEVLPAIRRTGAYAISDSPNLVRKHLRVSAQDAPDIVRAIQLAAETVARVAGVKPEIVAAETLHVIQDETGLCMERLRKVLPANAEPLSNMNATQLGKEVGLSARDINQRLATLGLQFKNPRGEWELTEAGKAHGEALPYATGRHAGYQVLWRASVLSVMRADAA